MRSARGSGVDTFSNLPHNVLDRILECLPLKDAVKTSIFSKGWRYKWVTRQKLEFDDNLFKSPAHVQEAKTIIYQVLLLHQGPILKFRLQSNVLESCPDINHWIFFLSKKNVQEFTLHINNSHYLPSHLFTFHQLRHLELYDCYFNPPTSFKGFDRLVNLELHCVTLVPPISRNLISMCPLLERLTLWWCIGFDILEIDAANLKYFQFRGKSKSICFKNAPMLGKIDVSLYSNSPVLTDASPVFSNFMKFFHYMPSLRELDINGGLLQYLIMGDVPENPPTSLNNVKFLTIWEMSFGNIQKVSSFFYLITSCPKLQTLTLIDCNPVSNVAEPVVEFLQAQSVSYNTFKLLQRVHIVTFRGTEVEMEFVRFILASAPVLEEFYVWDYDDILNWTGEHLMDEMKKFRRASPNVEFKVE